MRRILVLAALAAADDHIHASHADIELARDFRVDKHHKIIVSNIGDEDLAFYYLGNEGNQGMEHPEPTWDMSETPLCVLGPGRGGRALRAVPRFVRRAERGHEVARALPHHSVASSSSRTGSRACRTRCSKVIRHRAEAPRRRAGRALRAGGQSSRAIPHGHRLELRDDGRKALVAVEEYLPTRTVRVVWSFHVDGAARGAISRSKKRVSKPGSNARAPW